MIRDSVGNLEYWNRWVDFAEKESQRRLEIIKSPSGNPSYRPQFVYSMSNHCYEQMLRRYSRGDDITTLSMDFDKLIKLWEDAEELGKGIWSAETQIMRHSWARNLDHYICCFWLVGFALALDISESLWSRLIVLIGNEGEDELLDRVISVRQRGREIGRTLCHPKPYARLLAAINPNSQQEAAVLLRDFVENWYKELDRLPKKGMHRDTAMYERPYWYDYGNENFEGGAYFGRWCVEAVAAVKAFSLDDSLCLGHPSYPGDLIHMEGGTHVGFETHPMPQYFTPTNKLKKWLKQLLRL